MSAVYLSVQEIALRWDVSPMTVHRLINDGSLRAIRVGRQRRVHESEYERYVSENPATIPAEIQAVS